MADTPMGTISIAPNVYWVGVKDHSRKLFDGLISLSHGTSYNAYLVVGSEKTAVIDTTNPGFEQVLDDKISQHADITKIDYVIMNHAEPDHANAAKYVLEKAKGAMLVTTAKGKEFALAEHGIPGDRVMVVDEGSSIDLGGKTLKFIDAPWLHWPETMFTYLEEDGILFPCDFFGSHIAYGQFYADEFGYENTLDLAKLYFAEIMMPFRTQGKKALEKVRALNPRIIAPSHGVIHRDPKFIMDAYADWTDAKMKRKVLIAYVSMWGSSKKMADVLHEALVKKGIEVQIYDLTATDVGLVAKELVDTPVLVIAAPTVLAGVHPVAAYAALLVKALRAPTKYAAVLTSHLWSGGAVKQLSEILGTTKIEIIGVVDVKGAPRKEDLDAVLVLADTIEKKLG
ncbi:MAG: FprA family A-type flavoprotein [Thermoplasmata archaeon]|nr:FprA family A-type flavoprotein [Thermoplasmata archaeon]